MTTQSLPQADLDSLLSSCIEWYNVGSRVTCFPPITDTDRDVLCLVSDWRSFVKSASDIGFVLSGSVPADEMEKDMTNAPFVSLKRGEDNLIVTANMDFTKRFMAATRLAARFNMRSKHDRIALFQAVLYGN